MDAPVDAWLEVIGAPDALVRPVVCGLGEQGVQLCSRNGTPGRPHHGVVLFAGSPAAAADSIHAVADGGCERILALSAAGDRLGSASWSLLRAGASDVFSWHDASSARQVSERLRRWQAIDELADCPLVHELGQSPSSRRSSAWLEHSSRSITVSIAAHGRASISLNAIWAGDTSRATLGAMAIWSANDTATSWRVDSNRTRQQDVGQPWPGSCSVDPA